jgi:hypothetical protein
MGGGYVKYPELKLSCSQLWAKDGTHLSPLGKEVFLNTLQGDKIGCHVYANGRGMANSLLSHDHRHKVGERLQ